MYEPREVADAARAILSRVMEERLTPTEARRVRMLYAQGLTERQAAGEEGVRKFAVQTARDAALGKLEHDWRVWLVFLLEPNIDWGGGAKFVRDTRGPNRPPRQKVRTMFTGRNGWVHPLPATMRGSWKDAVRGVHTESVSSVTV